MDNKKKEAKKELVQSGHGINLMDMDQSVRPCDDFYQYACGGWIKGHPLSERPNRFMFNRFTELSDQNQQRLHGIIHKLCEAKQEFGTIEQKITDLYKLALDVDRLNREGASPLAAVLKKIKSYNKKQNLTQFIADLHHNYPIPADPFFSYQVRIDDIDSESLVVHLFTYAGILFDSDILTKDTDNNLRIRQGYRDFMTKSFMQAGYSKRVAQRMCNTIYGVQLRIIEASEEINKNRKDVPTDNVFSIDRLQKEFPTIDWKAYFEIQGFTSLQSVIVANPEIIAFVIGLMRDMTTQEIHDYISGLYISFSSALLSEEMYDTRSEFFGNVLFGTDIRKPREERAMSMTESLFCFPLGQIYVKHFFTQKDKLRVLNMVHAIRAALAARISSRKWMSNETKIKALVKLNALDIKVGYPDQWPDFSNLVIDPNRSLVENITEVYKFHRCNMVMDYNHQDLHHGDWPKPAHWINACYMPRENEICVLAGILQPPFYNPDADDAVNYGAIGIIISHELIHAFDDKSRLYDQHGNLVDWWTKEDDQAFKAVAEKLVNQYNQIAITEELHVDGELTLTENIADLGGINVALDAFTQTRQYREGEKIDGFTPVQRFFISYGQQSAEVVNEEVYQSHMKKQCHPLSRYRVNTPLRNLHEFVEAFNIQPGDEMWLDPDERITIW